MFAYHSLCDSLESNSRKIKPNNQIKKDGEREKGGGAKILLKRSVLNANHGAYRRLSGLIGFGRPAEFGLYRPRLLPARPALAWPMAYRPAYRRPGPLGTLPAGKWLPLLQAVPALNKYPSSETHGSIISLPLLQNFSLSSLLGAFFVIQAFLHHTCPIYPHLFVV